MIGILCLDGLDWNLFQRHELGGCLPEDAVTQRLENDLPGPAGNQPGEQRDRMNLFTPYVWTAIFSGEPRNRIDGWKSPDSWLDHTKMLTFLWERVPNTSVNNMKVHGHYLNENAVIPEGWVPSHDGQESTKTTALDLLAWWNHAVREQTTPLLIMWWRWPDAAGHNALKREVSMGAMYSWAKKRFFPMIEFPDRWLIVSDHGFQNDTENGPRDSGSHGSRLNHTPDAVLAWNFLDREEFVGMTDFVTAWLTHLERDVSKQNLEALGYTDTDTDMN